MFLWDKQLVFCPLSTQSCQELMSISLLSTQKQWLSPQLQFMFLLYVNVCTYIIYMYICMIAIYTSSTSSAYVFISLSTTIVSTRSLTCLVFSKSAPSPEHLSRAFNCETKCHNNLHFGWPGNYVIPRLEKFYRQLFKPKATSTDLMYIHGF